MSVPDPYGLLDDVAYELRAKCVGPRALQVGPLHRGGPQGFGPLLQHCQLPQLVAHRGRPRPHLLVELRREPPAGRPPFMGLGQAGPKVGRYFGLRSTEEARGIQHRVPVGGPVGQDSHRWDVVHTVRRDVALLVMIEPV